MTFLGWPQWIVLPYLFVLGTAAGSFLNVCIYRLPRYESLWDQLRGLHNPRSSHCPRCGQRILLRDNIPIFGWILLGGRCRSCHLPIAMRYPLIELFNGLLWVLLYWMEVPSDFAATMADSCVYAPLGPHGLPSPSWLSPAVVANVRFAYHLVLVEALVVATFIDFDLKIIPDGSTLPAMVVGVLGGWIFGQVHLVPVWFQDPGILRTLEILGPGWWPTLSDRLSEVPAWIEAHPHLHGLAVSLAGMFVGWGLVLGVRWMGKWVLKQEAMGFGDVVLMAMIGSFLGWQPTVMIFFIAPLCALVVVAAGWIFRREREIPYGPYLSLGALVVIFGWKRVWPAAERIFELGILLPALGVVTAGAFLACLQTIQLVKRLLGIPLYHEEWIEEWTSADQLIYQAGEHVDHSAGSWQRGEWPGVTAGRGTAHEHRWRNGG